MIPYPDLELTMEQQFKLRQFADAAEHAPREVLIKACSELQRQNFMLNNTVLNLVKNWDHEADTKRASTD
jgi:hypothetical protein